MKSGRVYNKKMVAFLAENYPKMWLEDLTREFNKTFGTTKAEAQIKACLNNHGIKAGVKRNRTPRRYQDVHLKFLQEKYLTLNINELTVAFNEEFPKFKADVKSIRACLKNNKITCGRTGHFEPGKTPWNTGMKGVNTGGEKGWFKKGAVPINYKPVGTERVNTDGYVEIKVCDPNKWRLKHRVVWEEEFGAIPEGHNITFKDNNPLNVAPENLMLISRSQAAIINKMGLSSATGEGKKSALLIADLTMALKKANAA